MDPDVQFVRLSTLLEDAYLHAADDARSVCLDACQASDNAVWAVERRTCTDVKGNTTAYTLLRGAYGRYLGALDKPSRSFPCLRVIAAQHDCDEPVVKAILWQVVQRGSHITLMSTTGDYLEYYSRPCNSSKTRFWHLEILPRLSRPQRITEAKPKWVNLLGYLQTYLQRCSSEREVNWIFADNTGHIDETGWGKFLFSGRDICSLEKVLRQLVPLPTTLCIRAGSQGQPTPLRINLPRSNEPLHVVLYLNNTIGSGRLMYPDMSQGAPPEEVELK